MYDTVKLSLDTYHGYSIEDKLGEFRNDYNRFNGESYWKYKIVEGLYIGFNNVKVVVNGSFPKFYLGDNFQVLTRQGTEKALEKVNHLIGVDISQAKVKRLDLAYNYAMKEPVARYLSLFSVHKGTLTKSTICDNETIYYNNRGKKKSKTVVIYDKVLETVKQNEKVPELFSYKNLLRFELRFLGINKQTFGMPIEAKTLFDEQFYIERNRDFIKEYLSIYKVRSKMVSGTITSSWKDTIASFGVAEIVNNIGVTVFLDMVKAEQKKGNIPRGQAKRITDQLMKRIEEHKTENCDLVKELDTKFLKNNKHFR